MRDIGLTFAGGGNRAFYQLGLMAEWPDLWDRVAAVAACSAGACIVTMILSGRVAQSSELWRQRRRGVTRNLDWRRLLRGQSPAPHGPIYFDTLLHTYEDGGLDRIRAQPFPIHIVTAAPPRGVPASLAVPLGMATYNLEKRVRPRAIHPSWGRAIGFSPVIADARACETPEELAELVIASSATPPFTKVGSFAGRALLDGGLVDNVPVFALDDESAVKRQLILLTRPYPEGVAGRDGERLYLAPTGPVPVERWDYTRPDLVDATIEMGRREASLHRPALDALLS